MKLLFVLVILFPALSLADPSTANLQPGDLLLRSTVHKSLDGNWERGRERAIKSWNYACEDWKEDVEDALPKDQEVYEIRCGTVRCVFEGKRSKCHAEGYVTYQKKESSKKD